MRTDTPDLEFLRRLRQISIAQEDTADATRELAHQQAESAREFLRAQEDLAAATSRGLGDIAAAEREVAEAQRELADSQARAEWATRYATGWASRLQAMVTTAKPEEIARNLIENDCLHSTDAVGMTVLDGACEIGARSLAHLLLDARANYKACAVIATMERGDTDLFNMLLDHFDLCLDSLGSLRAPGSATYRQLWRSPSVFVLSGRYPDFPVSSLSKTHSRACYQDGETPLEVAINLGKAEFVARICDTGAVVPAGAYLNSLLALNFDLVDILEVATNELEDVSDETINHLVLVLMGAIRGRIQEVPVRISNIFHEIVDVELPLSEIGDDRDGPLFAAVESGRSDILADLLHNGADLRDHEFDLSDSYSGLLIRQATLGDKRAEIITQLIDAGIKATPEEMEQLMWVEVKTRRLDILPSLVGCFGIPSGKIMQALDEYADVAVLDLLLDAGGDPDQIRFNSLASKNSAFMIRLQERYPSKFRYGVGDPAVLALGSVGSLGIGVFGWIFAASQAEQATKMTSTGMSFTWNLVQWLLIPVTVIVGLFVSVASFDSKEQWRKT